LQRAHLARAAGDSEAVRERLRLAVALEPGDADLRWDSAMLALRAGLVDEALGYLRDFVRLRPRRVAKAVLTGRRWLPEPGALVERLVGDQREALERLLVKAARWQDWDLAAAVWERLPEEARTAPDLAGRYGRRLVGAGRMDEAVAVTRAARPDTKAEAITNGGFERALDEALAFEWRRRAPDGATIERDDGEAATGDASLRLTFDGEHNLRGRLLWQNVAVTPGATYRLTGQWRSDALTTRSLPYWQVIARGEEGWQQVARLEAPRYGSWRWQSFEAELTVPEGVTRIQIRLRRNATDALDRFIGGDLYVDDLALAR
jgi:hypothetical protein